MGDNDNGRISTLTEYGLMGLAIVADGVELLVGPLPALASIVAIVAYIGLVMWFALLKVNFFGGKAATKRFGTLAIGFIVELLGGLLPVAGGFIPGTIVTTISLIRQTREEDKEKAAEAAAAAQRLQEERIQAQQARQQAMREQLELQAANDEIAAQEAA